MRACAVGRACDRAAATYPSGALSVNNAPGRDAIVEVDWSIPANFLPPLPGGWHGSTSIRIDLVFSDLDTNVAFFAGNALLASALLPSYDGLAGYPPAPIAPVDLPLGVAQWNLLAAGGATTLRMVLTGAPDWDLTIDRIGFHAVPEPAESALWLGGLLFLAGVRWNARRRSDRRATRGCAAASGYARDRKERPRACRP